MTYTWYTQPFIPLVWLPMVPRPSTQALFSCRQNIYFCLLRWLIRQKWHFHSSASRLLFCHKTYLISKFIYFFPQNLKKNVEESYQVLWNWRKFPLKPKEMFSVTYEVINKARTLQILQFGSSWKLKSRGEFQYTEGISFILKLRVSILKRKLPDWRYPYYTKKKILIF